MISNITRVLKVGSSLAITLQPNILNALALKKGDRVGVWVEGEYAVIRRIPMEELIKIRPEIVSNPANGEEVDNG
jgi:antitoxin component of MazEF toxin-antitoxin module